LETRCLFGNHALPSRFRSIFFHSSKINISYSPIYPQNQLFLDIFPLFRSPSTTEIIISHLTTYITTHYPSPSTSISAIVCLEARGFFFAPIIASRLRIPCVPVRKKGKLPGEVVGVEYVKDYGVDEFEMSGDSFEGLGEKPKVNLISKLLSVRTNEGKLEGSFDR